MPTRTTHPDQHTRTWSFHQAWQRARVPDKAARSLHSRGLIPDTNLTAGDILTLRAVTATSRFGLWSDLPAALSSARDRSLQRLCHDLTAHQSPHTPPEETLAMVLPQVAMLTTASDITHDYLPHTTALLLPVGYWAHCLHRDGRLPSEANTP